jgi:hypothetical protein
MNVGLTSGVVGSAAGTGLAQTNGAETERAQKDSTARERVVDGQNKSEKAAGLGAADEDQQTGERDADGRRLWEAPEKRKKNAAAETGAESEPARQAKDPTGFSGSTLDLTG